jgi:simple sugar transport system permease protein
LVLDAFLGTTTLAVALGLATPIVLAATGECLSELSGTLNVGIEGAMLTAALAGALGSYYGGSVLLGLLAAVLAAVIVLGVHGLLSIGMGADQIVSGVAINVGALGGTAFFARLLLEDQKQVPRMDHFELPLLSEIPFVGDILFSQRPLTYLALALPLVLYFVIAKTKVGVRVRALGDAPAAAEAVGIDVHLVRYGALLAGAACMGLGGAFLSIAAFNGFVENMTGGIGFIALAAVVFGNWRPIPVAGAALIFGYLQSLQAQLQSLTSAVPSELFLMLPYLVTVIVVVAAVRRDRMPAALAQPYKPRGTGFVIRRRQSWVGGKPTDAEAPAPGRR